MERGSVRQVALARHLGVAQSSICNYLRGRVPQAEILQRLSGFFNVPIENLLNGNVLGTPDDLQHKKSAVFPAMAQGGLHKNSDRNVDKTEVLRHLAKVAEFLKSELMVEQKRHDRQVQSIQEQINEIQRLISSSAGASTDGR